MQPRRALLSALAVGSLAATTLFIPDPDRTVTTAGATPITAALHPDERVDRSTPGTAPSRPTSSTSPTTATSTTEVAVSSSTTTSSPPPTTASPPPAPTTTAPPSPGSGGDCGGWGDLIAAYFPGEVGFACRVMLCESGGDPSAQNPSGASGLFQIMPGWASRFAEVTGVPYYDGRFDPAANTRFAAWLRYEDGWDHWVCA